MNITSVLNELVSSIQKNYNVRTPLSPPFLHLHHKEEVS